MHHERQRRVAGVLHIHNAFIVAKDASMEIQKRGAPQCYDPTLSFNSDQDPTCDSVVTEKTALFQDLQEEDLYIKIKYKKLSRHLEPQRYKKATSKTSKQASSESSFVRRRKPGASNQFPSSSVNSSRPLTSTPASSVQRLVLTMSCAFSRKLLKPSSSAALHRHSNALVDILLLEADSTIAMLGAGEKPDVTYQDVGGMDSQKQEIREAVELPLTHFDLYKKIGIDPPRGVLLYGPPGMSA